MVKECLSSSEIVVKYAGRRQYWGWALDRFRVKYNLTVAELSSKFCVPVYQIANLARTKLPAAGNTSYELIRANQISGITPGELDMILKNAGIPGGVSAKRKNQTPPSLLPGEDT